jgi:hypothetical protein
MNKNDEDYIKIQLKVDNEKRRHLDKTKKIISSTEYAKIHLKENLDWYKIKYKDIVSSRRNQYITEYIDLNFNNIDRRAISKYLTRCGFLSGERLFCYIIILMVLIYILLYKYIPFSPESIIFTTSILSIVFPAVLMIFYTETSIIKLYFTRKLKE